MTEQQTRPDQPAEEPGPVYVAAPCDRCGTCRNVREREDVPSGSGAGYIAHRCDACQAGQFVPQTAPRRYPLRQD